MKTLKSLTRYTLISFAVLFLSTILLAGGCLAAKNGIWRQRSFDRFLNRLFLEEVDNNLITLHYTLADPGALGIDHYGKTFGSVSVEDSRQALEGAAQLKAELAHISPKQLRPDQALTWEILNAWLDTELTRKGLELYDQPLSPTVGVQAQLPVLLAEYAFYSEQDVKDYLELLSAIDEYYQSILDFEQQKTQAGLGLGDVAIDRIIQSCGTYLTDADDSFLAESFQKRLETLEGISPELRQRFLEANHQVLEEHFLPAYRLLSEGLAQLKGQGAGDVGLCALPEGRRYYEYLVQSCIGPSYPSIEALEKAVAAQMLSDLTAMNSLLVSHPELAAKASFYSFEPTEPLAILKDLEQQCSADFPSAGDCSYSVKAVPEHLEETLSPAFYLSVPLDRPEDHSIYINNGSTNRERNLYPTLAHEGYPGHMYQAQYFNRSNACRLRKLLSFTSYNEGWATYVEYYSYGLNNGLEAELGQLLQHNSAFTLALYAYLDLNIHYEGWDLARTTQFLNQFFEVSDPELLSEVFYDIAENPVNYLEYYGGYLEILNMRKEAVQTLGSSFSVLDFHTFLLDIGPAPFSLIHRHFEEWLEEKTAKSAAAFFSPQAQLSICRPRKPAAVAASFNSISPNFALGSRLMITTEPMASPSQMIGDTTCAVIPSSSSLTRGT